MGIIKTAMMSGAAMYGIKQLAKTQEHRQSRTTNDSQQNTSQRRELYDPEYVAWQEWKSQQNAGSNSGPGQWENPQNQGQRRLLTDGETGEPRYFSSFEYDRGQPGSQYQYERAELRPQRDVVTAANGASTTQSNHSGGFDITPLLGKGMDLVQSGGKGGKGDFLDKFLSK
ncbi:uncharacterized protein PV07_11067 [Cladophialophora immunda]|uniref:Uncharacterized protein n=1 Tax=Cladophialophora immunda TaxID=569365 RepID=A0A0D1Z5A6_9EURO|nr:uncharacterized protein PV07_11067 [Cladophialophora immunda]KIW22806.1 hypothetical protein PV07_11067 [Cladophialophora immunda]OQU93963.1 hypothetical protein CLAIMM_00396 [Cladophialophora immunda]